MSDRGRGGDHGRSSHSNNRGRGSGRTSSRSRTNDGSGNGNSNKTEKVEFTPHCAGKTQGTTHDTVKKQIIHDIGGKHKCGNNSAESIKNENEHRTKEASWKHLKFKEATFVDNKTPMQMGLVEHKEFVKERNEQFRVCQDNSKKAHSLICDHCKKSNANQIGKRQ